MTHSRGNRIAARSPLRMAGSILRQPLALLVAFSMLPKMPITAPISMVQEARAQMPGCGDPKRILKAICTTFEEETVKSYLALHGLPESDLPLVYEYGRTDLRNEIRAFMMGRIVDAINETPGERSFTEQQVYDFMRASVWQREKDLHKAALDDRNAWAGDPCNWVPDPELAKTFGLTYDGTKFCGSSLLTLLKKPAAPVESYFKAAALQKAYLKDVANTEKGPLILAETQARMLKVIGIAEIPGAVASIVAAIAITKAVPKIFPQYSVAKALGRSLSGMARASGFAASIIIQVAVVVGVIAAFQAIENDAREQELARMDATYRFVSNNAPDLAAMSREELGILKLGAVFTAATLPEYVNNTPLPFHRAGDPEFVINGTASESLAFRDEDNNLWTARTYGGWFLKTCSGENCRETTSFSPTLEIVNPAEGKNRPLLVSYKGRGDRWFATDIGDSTIFQSPCYDAGVTDSPFVDPTNGAWSCSVYRSDFLHLRGGDGLAKNVTLTQTPFLISAHHAVFTQGVAGTFQIVSAAQPAAISANNALPPGFQIVAQEPDGTATLKFSGAAAAGTYNIALTARSGSRTQQQTLIVNVATQVTITGLPDIQFTVGKFSSYDFSYAGSPAPTLQWGTTTSVPAGLPAGVTLTNHGGGRATISGTPSPNSPAPPCSPSYGILGSNGFHSAIFPVCVKVQPPSIPEITSAHQATFAAGVPNLFPITTKGSDLPVTIAALCDTLPSWLTLRNTSTGGAVLEGTPPKGADGSVTFSYAAYLAGAGLTTMSCTSYRQIGTGPGGVPILGEPYFNPTVLGFTEGVRTFTVNVVSGAFTSPEVAIFEAGKSGSFNITANVSSPAITHVGQAPPGLQFGGNLAGRVLSGTPAAGSGGLYDLKLTLSTGVGTATQNLQVAVLEATSLLLPPPTASSPLSAINMVLGVPNSYTFQIAGFPLVPAFGQRGVTIVKNPFVPLDFPPGIALSQAQHLGQPTGKWILTGVPTQTGYYPVTLAATNGVPGSPAQNLMIRVIKPGDLNASGAVDCADVGMVRSLLGKRASQNDFDHLADANNDGIIDIRDLAMVSARLPAGTRCN